MKELKIEVPNGYEIDKDKSTFENIVFKKKDDLPNSWEDLECVKGYCVDAYARAYSYNRNSPSPYNKSTFATKEQAEASIALAQLSQLMKAYNGDWTPNWSDTKTHNYVISFYGERIGAYMFNSSRCFLAFKSKELRDKFLENFRDLIEKAKPLL